MEPEKVDAELNIEPKKDEKVPDEKTELQREVEELRKKNHDLEAVAGRVSGLNTMINNLENTMDEKINNLVNTKQPVKEEEITAIDDDDYLTGKKAKQLIGDAVKEATANQGEVVEKALTARDEKSKKWNDDYMKEVAKQSMDIGEDETLQGILSEMDANFRDDTIRDPKLAAELNYNKAKASYTVKAMAAGKQIKFGSGKPPVAPLGVGNPGGEKIITKPEKEIAMPEDAKEVLFSLEKDPEKRKTLAKEALG
jgi:hypothetical protein